MFIVSQANIGINKIMWHQDEVLFSRDLNMRRWRCCLKVGLRNEEDCWNVIQAFGIINIIFCWFQQLFSFISLLKESLGKKAKHMTLDVKYLHLYSFTIRQAYICVIFEQLTGCHTVARQNRLFDIMQGSVYRLIHVFHENVCRENAVIGQSYDYRQCIFQEIENSFNYDVVCSGQ